MWTIETDQTFPLSSVKPLETLQGYRDRCLAEMRRALREEQGTHRRMVSPITGEPLVPFGTVEEFEYLRCPGSGSVFLADLPSPEAWRHLLSAVSRYRHSPETFHAGIVQTRKEHVYGPKLEWVRNTLRMQRLEQQPVLEVVTPPSEFTAMLEGCGAFSSVTTCHEMELIMSPHPVDRAPFGTAVLFESLDRVDDPVALLTTVKALLAPGGLIFVTALVSTGFDMVVLGLNNLYWYPPDRTNCFSLRGLQQLLRQADFSLLEVSTPGVLDVEIVQAHWRRDPTLALSSFERQLLTAEKPSQDAFQTFLQQHRMSSFARIIGKKGR